MAVAFSAGSNSGNALVVGSSNTFSHTCGGSDTLLVVGTLVRGVANAVTGITYNGVALTKINHNSTDSTHRIELWYLLNPSSGTHDIVASWVGVEDTMCGGASFTGAGTPTNWATAYANSAANISVDVTSATGGMVVDIATIRWNEPLTVGAGQTQICNMTNASQQTGMSYEAGATSVTMSWTWDLDPARDWVIAGVHIPAAAVSNTTNFFF